MAEKAEILIAMVYTISSRNMADTHVLETIAILTLFFLPGTAAAVILVALFPPHIFQDHIVLNWFIDYVLDVHIQLGLGS